MNSLLDILAPEAVGNTAATTEQKLTSKLAGFEARLDAFERTRASTGVGTGDPTGVPRSGTRWMDQTNRRLWVYTAGRGWVPTDAGRAEAFASATVATTGTNVNMGPVLTIWVPAPAILSVQADVEMFPVQSGTNFSNARVLINPYYTGGYLPVIEDTGIWNTWRRMLSAAGRDGGFTLGNTYPVGGFLNFNLPAAGVYQFELAYSSIPVAGPAQSVSFRNRRLWGVVL